MDGDAVIEFNHSDEMTAAYQDVCGCERCAASRNAAHALATIHADTHRPVRKVVISTFIETDASPEDIARAFRAILDGAGVAGYQLGVSFLESTL